MDENKNLARHRVNSEIDLGERIMVIGCGGSGKSTLSRSLGELLNLPVVHLDRLYWRDGWRSVDDEEFDALLSEALSQGRWIIDGNFNRTIAMRLNRCDTVIYLDYARIVCMAGVIKRVLAYYGRTHRIWAENARKGLTLSFSSGYGGSMLNLKKSIIG